jgi:hypothetical protein
MLKTPFDKMLKIWRSQPLLKAPNTTPANIGRRGSLF